MTDPPMRRSIFISYRRDDSAEQVHGIAQYLAHALRRHVFVDVDLPAASNFPQELEKRLARCKVLLALIGPGWVDARDDTGGRRLDDPNDWVRLEIGRALERGIAVIPVTVAGAQLPARSALPKDLWGLLDHQAATVSARTFRNDMAGLARDIKTLDRPWKMVAVVAAAVLVIATASYGAWRFVSPEGGPSPTVSAPRITTADSATSRSTETAPVDSPPPKPVEATPAKPAGAAGVLAHCVQDERHPDGADIARRLAQRFASRKFRYGWTAERQGAQDPDAKYEAGIVWHEILDASATDDALTLRIPWRDGRLRLVPVVQQRFSTRSISVSLLLQGMWSQDNGYGCIALTFDDRGEAKGAIGVMRSERLDTQAFIRRVE